WGSFARRERITLGAPSSGAPCHPLLVLSCRLKGHFHHLVPFQTGKDPFDPSVPLLKRELGALRHTPDATDAPCGSQRKAHVVQGDDVFDHVEAPAPPLRD